MVNKIIKNSMITKKNKKDIINSTKKEEKNKNEDFHQIDYNKNINNLKTNEIEYKRLNEQEIKNKA